MNKRIKVDNAVVEAAILGGTVLGGGGGGWIEEGKKLAKIALGNSFSQILSLDDIADDGLLLTVSAVGAPSAGKDILHPEDYVRAVDYFLEKTGMKVSGLISSEIGGVAVVNGWVQSAFLKIPVIDAPANGRAHPLGLMGSMGLSRKKNYVSYQVAVGRNPGSGGRIEEFFSGSLEETSKVVREVAVRAGGVVAVARNPVPASHVREKGAPGAIRRAIEIGQIYHRSRDLTPEKIIKEIFESLGGNFLDQGKVEKFELHRRGGFDLGRIEIKSSDILYELTFWNEYMTLDSGGKRLATFPDLIMTFDRKTGSPLLSAAIEEGLEVFLIAVPAHNLLLGAGVKEEAFLRQVEVVTGKEILKYVRDLG